MKVGDKVKFFEWDENLRNAKYDPNAKYGIGTIVNINFEWAGYDLDIQADDGRILNLNEIIHSVEVIEK